MYPFSAPTLRQQGYLPVGDGLHAMGRAGPLPIDGLGHLPIDVAGAKIPFRIVAGFCERRSVVSAANLKSGRWGEVPGGVGVAKAGVAKATVAAGIELRYS